MTSASERLRALDARMVPRERWSCWIPDDAYETHGMLLRDVEWAVCDVRNALSLIADVVEAAERTDHGDEDDRAALRRSLTALRDALEEK